MMRIKKFTCDEHPVLYGTVESLNCTPETNITLEFKRKLFKKYIVIPRTHQKKKNLTHMLKAKLIFKLYVLNSLSWNF